MGQLLLALQSSSSAVGGGESTKWTSWRWPCKGLKTHTQQTWLLVQTLPLFAMYISCLRAAITKYHRLAGLNSRNLFFSQFQRPESKIMVSVGLFLLRPLSLDSDGYLLPVSSHSLCLRIPSVRVICTLSPLLIRTLVIMDQGPKMTSFELLSLKTLLPNSVTF